MKFYLKTNAAAVFYKYSIKSKDFYGILKEILKNALLKSFMSRTPQFMRNLYIE